MNALEKSQVVNMTIQSMLLLVAVLGALYIGFKQNDISQQLLDIQYIPSVAFAVEGNQFRIYSKSKENIWLYGTQTEGLKKNFQEEPRLITPGGYYYIPVEPFKAFIKQQVGNDGEKRIRINLFIQTAHERRYTIRNVLYCAVISGKVEINPQTIGMTLGNWKEINL